MSSNNHGDFKDQAHELRERIKREQIGSEPNSIEEKDVFLENREEKEPQESVELLNLPPRSVVHNQTKKSMKIKIKFPLVRLLVLIFILILLSIPFYHIWQSKYEDPKTSSSSNDTKAGERVSLIQTVDASEGIDEKELKEQNDKEETENKISLPKEAESEPPTNDKNELTLVPTKEEEQKSIDEENQNSNDVQEQTPKGEEEQTTPRYYQVKKGDTLFSIAMEFYGGKWGETLILEANNLNRREVFAGETLLIPDEEE